MLLVVIVNCIMSINVTVPSNPTSVKRGRVTLTDVNELKKQELNRRRMMRIEQVRQQSKDIANHVRKRVQQKKNDVLKAAEMKENSELRNCQQKKLKLLQQKYHECLDEVGLAHTHAALQPDPVSVLAAQIERISDQAKIRGKQALEKKNAENRKASESEDYLREKKKSIRAAEDLRSEKIVSRKKIIGDRAERIPLTSNAVNIQQTHLTMGTGSERAQESVIVTEQQRKDLLQLDDDTSDSSSSTPVSDEELQVSSYEFGPTTSSKYSGKLDVIDSASDFGDVLKACYSDLMPTEHRSGRKKSPQFVELPEVIVVDGRESPNSQEERSNQYLISSDRSYASHSRTLSSGNWSKRPEQYKEASPEVVSGTPSAPELVMSGECITEQKPVLQPVLSERLETAPIYSQPRTVPVWQTRASLRSVTSCPSGHKVHFYDHSSRYQQQCFHPKEVVQKVDEPFQKTAVQIAEEVAVASEATQKEKLKTKLHREQLQQCRSNQALARERLKRQYSLLLSELESLSRKERLTRAQNISAAAPAIHMSEARWKERGDIRQKNMDSLFERVYHRSNEPHTEDDANTLAGLQGTIPETLCNKQNNIAVESEVKLNVGCCVPPQTAFREPTPGKELGAPNIMHSMPVSESHEQQPFRSPSQSKKVETAHHSQAPRVENVTDEVNIHKEKTSKPSSVRRADLESVAIANEALSVSNSSSSNMTSSSSSDISSDRDMSTYTESKILNSKQKINVLKNEGTKQSAGNNRITLLMHSMSTTGVSRAEHRGDTLKSLKGSSGEKPRKIGASKHYASDDGEDSKKQCNGAHGEELSRKANKSERLKFSRSKETESKKIEDNSNKVKLTSSSSSSSLVSDHSVLDRRETSTTSTDTHSSSGDVKIIVKVCDKSQELNGNSLYDNVDSEHLCLGTNKKAKEIKHCKEHCGKKALYRDIFAKETQKKTRENKPREKKEDFDNSGVSNSPQLDLGPNELDMSYVTSELPGKKVGKPCADDQVQRNESHNESDGSSDSGNNREKRGGVFKELDETILATSASTSYFSPPEKISATRVKEIAMSPFELNTQRTGFTVSDAQICINPQLSCYIRRLLAMSRESVENLSASNSDLSTQPEEILTCSTKQALNNDEFNHLNYHNAQMSVLPGKHADNQECVQQKLLDMKQGAEQTIDNCDTDVKVSNQANHSAVRDSDCGNVQFNASGAMELPGENRNSNSLELQGKIINVEDSTALECEKVISADDGSVKEANHNDLIVAMNKKIISALNEMNGTVSHIPVESNILGLKKPACNQNISESKVATDISSPQADLSELAEKYSKRVSDWSKKLENLRLEKQRILEISSSGSDREVCDATVYASPPLRVDIVPDVISTYQPENMQPRAALGSVVVPTSCQEQNGSSHSFRGKPPVSLSQRLIRGSCMPHELSTITEVDSPQVLHTQADIATENMEDIMIGTNTQSSIPEVSVSKERNSKFLEEGLTSAEDNNLSDVSRDVVREIMDELIQRKLLTSPYPWLKDEYEKKPVEHGSSMVDPALSNESRERENLDTEISQKELSSSHSVTDSVEQTSFQTSSKSENSNVELKSPLAHKTNIHQMDLHNVFEKLGIGWASSMLRKTRQAMTYSSSSSENSHDFSALHRTNSFRDMKTPKEKHQSQNCENRKSTVGQDLLQYKKEHFVPPSLGSKDVPIQRSADPENSIKTNISKTRDTDISVARDESCNDEHLCIKVPNISLTSKIKVSMSGSNNSS